MLSELRAQLEALGEALFHLSDKLRGSGFLNDDANHAEYEKVVTAFRALTALQAAEAVEVARKALEKIADGTEDREPPFRAMPQNRMQDLARQALAALPKEACEP